MGKKASKATKSKIVSAAWQLFYEQGYEDTTVDEIIALSGTSKGSFYHYFDGKDAFIAEILAERNRELAFESHQRWDLIRTGRPLRNADLPDAQKILPIPDYEVNISKGKIEQNTAFR